MASISMSISAVGRSSVTVSLSSSMANTSSYYEEFVYYTIYTDSKGTKNTTASSSFSVSYTPKNGGTDYDYVNAFVTYKKYTWEDTSGYVFYRSGSYESTTPKYGTEYYEDYMYTYSSVVSSITENEDGTTTTNYTVSYNIYVWSTSGYWAYDGLYTTSETWKRFYPAPNIFSFNGCAQGAKWLLKSGINSLITNIEDFYGVAQQWKSWSLQRSITSACPSFFNSNNELYADGLNNVYKYVGSTASYKKGDKVAASMFNSLATIINTTTYG